MVGILLYLLRAIASACRRSPASFLGLMHLPWHGMLACVMALVIGSPSGCATGPPDPGVQGNYQTWDDVIKRWIGKRRDHLFYELGPPNLHDRQLDHGYVEMMWDMALPSMQGQANEYGTLPMYGSDLDCKLAFVANDQGVIVTGRRIGCD
jgi:hypothetical protein